MSRTRELESRQFIALGTAEIAFVNLYGRNSYLVSCECITGINHTMSVTMSALTHLTPKAYTGYLKTKLKVFLS